MKHRLFTLLLCFAAAFLILVPPLSAQFYFGKNKVQYNDFDWRIMETEHFNIYFYLREAELAEIAAKSAENSYDFLSAKFGHEIYSRIPLIIYSSPNHFVQTNVTHGMLPENVGGFTEFIKGRVVMPFNGSFHDFDRILRHELVHVFMLSKIGRIQREFGKGYGVYPPLWFTEGLAETWSRSEDSETDLIVRDMVINGTLPSFENLWIYHGSYFMYKLGETICNFLQREYGQDVLTRMFDSWHVSRNFEGIVEYVTGEPIETVSRKWVHYLRKKYFPQIESLDPPDIDATPLTRQVFAVRPVPLTVTKDDGQSEQWVIYKANKAGYSGIYMMPADGDKDRAELLLKGDLSAKFESLHLMTSGVDQFDNRLIVFASKSRERDVLYLYDLAVKEVIKRYEFDDLSAIRSPRFSPDGSRVVFTGFRFEGYADLYMVNLNDSSLQRLTNDIYLERDPSFGYDGTSIIFSSDRAENGIDGFYSLYRLHLFGNRIDRLTWGDYHDRGPSESPDGSRIIFYSDRGEEAAINIFNLKPDGSITRLTHYITGAFDPRFGPDGEQIYFSAYHNRGFHIYKTKVNDTLPVDHSIQASAQTSWKPGKIDLKAGEAKTLKYTTKYSLDIAQSVVAYDVVHGALGGVQAAISDMLGDNSFIFLLSNTAREKDEFLSSFNLGITYLHQASRLNWGIGAFHLYDEYYNDFDGYYFERVAGGALYLSYPISKFNRIETSAFIRWSDKDVFDTFRRRQAVPSTHTISFVSDNSLWEATGPIDGRRLNITLGTTFDFKSGRNFNTIASVDFRHYLRIKQLSCLASRFFVYSSDGLEPQRLYLGGSWSFRGFSRRHFYNRNILFNSEEIRFPLINDLLIAFPIGDFRLRGIRGAFFHDMGTGWDDRWQGWHGSFGASIRIALGYLVVLRVDFSRTHDFKTISNDTRTDFFFGWNF